MQKLLSRTGIALCAIGILLGSIAITAHFSPPDDPTDSARYDASVDAYNDRVNEIAESNRELPAIQKGKTFLQAHKEDISDLVIAECADGDSDAARERLEVIDGIDVLQTTDAARKLGNLLIESHAVPATEPRDALHIALAATNGIDYLATWNFKHIMNPSTQHLIDDVCRNAGIASATICTPEQLLVTYGDP